MKQQTTVNYCTVLGELKTNGGHRCSVSTELIQEGSTLDTAAAKSRQLCPTLCDPIDGSPPGSPVPGILQARTLEWGAISFSNARKWKAKVKSLSRVWLFATPWTAAHQASPSMGVSRQEYWSGAPVPSPLLILLHLYGFSLLASGIFSVFSSLLLTHAYHSDWFYFFS